MTKAIPIRLTDETREELRKLSRESGIPVSTLIRNAIYQKMPEYREGRMTFPKLKDTTAKAKKTA